MKVLFFGTPDFGVAPLDAIYHSRHEIVGVVTQPDRPNARGNKIIFSAVKARALELGLPVLQYESIRTEEAIEELKDIGADVFVSAAYGQIFTTKVLDIPKHGIINVHASLLPKYRGSAPVNQAIIAGDSTLGVTIMKTALKVDSGDILLQKSADFTTENAEECLAVLSKLGGEAIVEGLDLIEEGKAVFVEQDHAKATYQPMISKADGIISYAKTPIELVNFVRGMTPWPSAHTTSKYGKIKVLQAEATSMTPNGIEGSVHTADKSGLYVNVKGGVVRITRLQLEGSKPMRDVDFLLGRKFCIGDILGG